MPSMKLSSLHKVTRDSGFQISAHDWLPWGDTPDQSALLLLAGDQLESCAEVRYDGEWVLWAVVVSLGAVTGEAPGDLRLV